MPRRPRAGTLGLFRVAVDAHAGPVPNLDHAVLHQRVRQAQALEPLDLLWLEDPVPPGNIEARRHVTHSTKTPICAGENLYMHQGYRELIE
ncbi:MAG: enolase C-terminal domain-like protein [Devosia sp.]